MASGGAEVSGGIRAILGEKRSPSVAEANESRAGHRLVGSRPAARGESVDYPFRAGRISGTARGADVAELSRGGMKLERGAGLTAGGQVQGDHRPVVEGMRGAEGEAVGSGVPALEAQDPRDE